MRITIGAIVAAIFASLAAIPAAAADKVKVAIVSRTVFFMPLWVADQKGFFRDEGIEAAIEVLDSAEKINDELQSGSAQVAISTAEAVMVRSYQGGTFRIVASVAQKPPHFIITKPSIRTLAELRGANFGVLSLHEGTTYLVQDLARAAGLAAADYRISAVGGAPTRWKLLQEGRIDAGLQPFPLSYESEAAGFNNLGAIASYVPDYEFTVVLVDEKWAAANRDLLTRLLRAMRRGQARMRTDPGGTVDIAVKELRTSRAFAERALADADRLQIMPDGLRVSERGLARVFETVKAAGLVPAAAPFERGRFVDESYWRAAGADLPSPRP